MEHPTASKDPSVLQLWESPEYILLAKSQFTHRVQNAVSDAMDDSCTAVESSLYPGATIDANPQMLFGNRAITSKIGPQPTPTNEGNIKGEAAQGGGDSEVKADIATQPEAGAAPKAGEAAASTDSPTRIPDFARLLIFGDKLSLEGYQRELLDFWELKRMKTLEISWASDEGKKFAQRDLMRRVEQTYDAAMAAFDHNPHWTKVTALLIVGIYFTQLVWSRPQTADMAPPSADPSAMPPSSADPVAVPPSSADPVAVPPSSADPIAVPPSSVDPVAVPPSSVDPSAVPSYTESTSSTASSSSANPALPSPFESDSSSKVPPSTGLDIMVPVPGPTDPDKYFERLAKVQEDIEKDLLDRCMPDIYFSNECCLETAGTDFTGRLSDKFLDALFLPIRDDFRDHMKFVHQPSWFDRSQHPPPKPMVLQKCVFTIRECLRKSVAISESVQALTGNLKRPDGRQDGFQTPPSAPATPFPSPQKGGRREPAPVPKREFNRPNRGQRIEPLPLALVAQSSAESSKTEPKPKTKTRAKGALGVSKKKGGPEK